MDFEAWLKAKGFDREKLTADQVTFFEKAWQTENPAGDGTGAGGTGEPRPGDTKTEDEVRAAAVAAERDRVAKIDAACKGFEGDRVAELRSGAMKGDIDLDALRSGLLEHVRQERGKPTKTAEAQDSARKMLLAHAYLAGDLPEEQIIKLCGEPAIEAAGKLRGMGIQEFCARAAAIEGVQLGRYQADPTGWLQGAFSTLSLPGILGNVANTYLLAGFSAVEDTWKKIAATRSVADFKTATSYRMTGDFNFAEVGPGGEIKHARVGEEEYTNIAKTYGKMFALTRTDLINDDMGAFASIPKRIGRGAALKLNLVFWTVFMNNATFFTAARGNYAAGAGTALSIDALTAAELLFLDQTDPDGEPLGVQPKVLLVPNALLVTGTQIMKSTELRDTTASTKRGTINPHAGKFSVEASSYLSNATITGNSALAWYLLALAADLAVIEIAFLNGRQRPTVERADADFNTLGIQIRGYFDFGVNLQEYRGGTKQKGEA